jgi:hypothetical protein
MLYPAIRIGIPHQLAKRTLATLAILFITSLLLVQALSASAQQQVLAPERLIPIPTVLPSDSDLNYLKPASKENRTDHLNVAIPSSASSASSGTPTTQAAFTSVTAKQTNNIVNAFAYYDVVFKAATTGAIKTIEVRFPAGTIVGGYGTFVEAEGIGPGTTQRTDTRTLKYTVDNAVSVPAGTLIRLEFSRIVNPPTPGDTYQLTVTTRNAAGNIIDGPTASIPYKIIDIGSGTISCAKLPVNSVTANGNDGNLPTNVIDNVFSTRWSNNGVGSWIQLDLGAKKSICSVDIGWYRGNVRQNDFVVSVSDDRTNFVNKFSGKSSGATTSMEKYNMPAGTEGRYVRVMVNGNTENNWASVTEIAIIGSGPTSPPPPGSNQPPTADSKSVTTSTNTAVDITLSGKDPENGPLSFTVADLPKSGKVAAIAGTTDKVRYTPNTGFTGSDSFTYTAKDNKGAVSAKATVSISVTSGGGGGGGGDAGQNDKFGIKKIYASKPNGEQWFMNMADPSNDPRTSEPSMSKNSDGSWRVTSGQVRYGVFTSSGYHPDQVVKDHGTIASRGYMQSPNDWKNVEMTGQVKYNSGGDDEWTWYARGGRHTGSGSPEGCEGVAYKGSLAYTGGQVRWAKEQWHVSYVFQPWKNSPADGDGKFVGFKVAIYNMQLNGKTVVKMVSWVDPNNNNQWQKVYDFIDQGGWGSEGEECGGAPDQIVTWGGPIASFRWDDGNSIDIKNLSVREIVPPSQ